MLKTAAMMGLLGLAVISAACSPVADLCAKTDQCRIDDNVEGDNDDSDDGEDDVAVCIAFTQGAIDSLRANDEAECKEYAAAFEDSLRCQAALDCDDLNDIDVCKDEKDRLEDICESIGKKKINCETAFGNICGSSSGGEGEGEDNVEGEGTCDFENDGECDDPTGSDVCPAGTDVADCA